MEAGVFLVDGCEGVMDRFSGADSFSGGGAYQRVERFEVVAEPVDDVVLDVHALEAAEVVGYEGDTGN